MVSGAAIRHGRCYSGEGPARDVLCRSARRLLEGLGRLLATSVKLYVTPMPSDAFAAALRDMRGTIAVKESSNGLVGLDDLMPAPPACHLLVYLRASGRTVSLERPQ